MAWISNSGILPLVTVSKRVLWWYGLLNQPKTVGLSRAVRDLGRTCRCIKSQSFTHTHGNVPWNRFYVDRPICETLVTFKRYNMASLRKPAWLNKDYMQNIAREHFKKPNISVQKIEITPGSKEGDNYSCQILRIKLDYEDNGDSKLISIIGKVIDSDDSMAYLFLIEAAAYSKLFPMLRQISPEMVRSVAPECYHVDYERNIIFLEDLVPRKFIVPTRGQLLSKEVALLTMEKLAVLHGGSLRAIQNDESLKETFQKSIWGGERNILESWFVHSIRGLEKNVDSYGLPEEWCKMLRNVGTRFNRDFFKICDFQESDLNVITHGDMWMNNLMYHISDGVIDDVLMLDFQFAAYNSFTIDLHFIIFSSVQADVLVNDMDTLLETYYKKLKEVAPELPNLTLERIKKEFWDKKFFGSVHCVLSRPVVYAMKPLDIALMDAGGLDEMGYTNPAYADDLHKLMPYFEEVGFFLENV